MVILIITHINNADNKLSSTLSFKFLTFCTSIYIYIKKSDNTTILKNIRTSIIKYL